jgi:hypothetical protein
MPETPEDQLVNAIIECIVEFRVRYGYARKLDDAELHEQLVTLLRTHDFSFEEEKEHA